MAVLIFESCADLDPSLVGHYGMALSNLSACFYSLGEMRKALSVSGRAVAIARRVASKDSESRCYLALALGQLSMVFSRLGSLTRSVAAAQESVDILRDVATDNPHRLLELATSLERLAMRLRQISEPRRAVALIQEAVDILAPLYTNEPALYGEEFARASIDLASCLSDVGQMSAAFDRGAGAVGIYQQLAQFEPATYTAALAEALTSLGEIHFKAGDPRGAARLTSEATDLLRRLVVVTPGAYEGRLANTLSNLSATLGYLHDNHGALIAAAEAVQLYRHPSFENHGDDLAYALINLGKCQADAGRVSAAIDATQEAVRCLRVLHSGEDASAYGSTLAVALDNLGHWLSQEGHQEAASKAIREAVQIRRELVERDPDIYLADLSSSLQSLAIITAVSGGSRGDALAAVQESLATARDAAKRLPERAEECLVNSLQTFAWTQWVAQDLVAARAAAEESIALAQKLTSGTPERTNEKLIDLWSLLSSINRAMATAPRGPAGLTEFGISSQELFHFGEASVREVCSQLWPISCQSCGASLVGAVPTVHFDVDIVPSAAIYHQECTPIPAPGVMYVSSSMTWRATALLLPQADGDLIELPTVILNPGLERVVLEKGPDRRWKVRPDGWVQGAGLVRPGPSLDMRNCPTIEGVNISTVNDVVALDIGDTVYEAPIEPKFVAALREAPGLLLIVSHAIWPMDLTNTAHIDAVLRSGNAVVGWIT
jgi:tetratricopeptide (TPR) repeat protein